MPLQQYLPFTVLKPVRKGREVGIFTGCNSTYRLRYWNKIKYRAPNLEEQKVVATVLTVYGIETFVSIPSASAACMLQQYLPFTVLKL